jgi:hypothetical protein
MSVVVAGKDLLLKVQLRIQTSVNQYSFGLGSGWRDLNRQLDGLIHTVDECSFEPLFNSISQ